MSEEEVSEAGQPSPRYSNGAGNYGFDSSGDSGPSAGAGPDSDAKRRDALRKGKWTPEEERYTNKVIDFFNTGVLQLPESERGVTLRAYLADKLGCDPMRITKKYTGASCLGKRVYHAQKKGFLPEELERASKQLKVLEDDFRQKLVQMNRKRSNSATVE
ncbi:hypothetical protein B484DRAFT_325500, partial [Ochromonadaceae sp. CCMP2298]